MCKSGPAGNGHSGGLATGNGQYRPDGHNDHGVVAGGGQRPSLSNMMLSGGPGGGINGTGSNLSAGKMSNSNLSGNHRMGNSGQSVNNAQDGRSGGQHGGQSGGNGVNGQQTVIALYTYQAKDEGDLSFKKGDRLLILDDKDPDWWLARHVGQIKSGYIPRNYVVAQAIQTEEYVFLPGFKHFLPFFRVLNCLSKLFIRQVVLW